MSLEHDQLSGIVGVVAAPGAQAAADERRRSALIQRVHHHAFFTKDAEATRHFYEDVLELKMVLTLVDEGDLHSDAPMPTPTPFLHFFFELGDGSMLAFFEALPIHGTRPFPELTIFDHHLSLKVPDAAATAHIKARLEGAGFKTFEMQHGFCNSLYVNDPNGLYLEFSYDTEEHADHFARAEQVSHARLNFYLANRERDRTAAALHDRAAVAPQMVTPGGN